MVDYLAAALAASIRPEPGDLRGAPRATARWSRRPGARSERRGASL